MDDEELGVCGKSKALACLGEYFNQRTCCSLVFNDKRDDTRHRITYEQIEPEYMTDADGIRWKRVN